MIQVPTQKTGTESPVTNCTATQASFLPLKRRKIDVDFYGGDITTDAGCLLLRQVDRRIGLTAAVDAALDDPRRAGQIQHTQLTLLQQRIYGLALGYEDLNDHTSLRQDAAFQTSVSQLGTLASQATLHRLERRANRETAVKLHQVLMDQFVASFSTPPESLILDFDATDDAVHGKQEGNPP